MNRTGTIGDGVERRCLGVRQERAWVDRHLAPGGRAPVGRVGRLTVAGAGRGQGGRSRRSGGRGAGRCSSRRELRDDADRSAWGGTVRGTTDHQERHCERCRRAELPSHRREPPCRTVRSHGGFPLGRRGSNPFTQVSHRASVMRSGATPLKPRAQPAACLTSSAIRFSPAVVKLVRAKATGHVCPSSTRASGWKPRVEYRTLNFDFDWKKQTPSSSGGADSRAATPGRRRRGRDAADPGGPFAECRRRARPERCVAYLCGRLRVEPTSVVRL